jgi:hypothetical protein
MPELINGTYVSAIVLASLIPALINCKWSLRPERSLRYKHCRNVILSEAKNLGSIVQRANGTVPEIFEEPVLSKAEGLNRQR